MIAPREAIALIASAAMLEIDGVAGPAVDPDGRFTTVFDELRLPGVVCSAAAAGGYDLTLYIRARPVPLIALGERVEAHVRAAVAAEGWADELADTHVIVTDMVVPR